MCMLGGLLRANRAESWSHIYRGREDNKSTNLVKDSAG